MLKQLKWVNQILRMNENQLLEMAEKAVQLQSQGLYQECIECANLVLSVYPNNEQLLILKAQTLQTQKRYIESLYYIDRLISINGLKKNLQDIKMETLRYLNCEQVLNYYSDNTQDEYQNHQNIFSSTIQALLELKRYEESLHYADRILAIQDCFFTFARKVYAIKLMSQDEVLRYFSILFQEGKLKLALQTSEILLRIKRHQESNHFINKYLAINPNCIKALIMKQNILFEIRQYKQAIYYGHKILLFDPNCIENISEQMLSLIELKFHKGALFLNDQQSQKNQIKEIIKPVRAFILNTMEYI